MWLQLPIPLSEVTHEKVPDLILHSLYVFFTYNLHTLGTNKFCIQSFQQTIIIELFPGSIIVSREGERTTEIASQKKKKIQRNQKRKSIPLLFTSVFATFSEADVAHEATLLEKQCREHYSQFIDKLVNDK